MEAARYALLRRLTFAMRHQMVAQLQPIGMLGELMERRLREPAPDLAAVGDQMAKVQGFARAGVGASLDFVSWLAPEPGVLVPLSLGVDECVRLLRTHFSFRGFALRSEVAAAQLVSRSALRMLLPAVLFGLADHADSPAEVVVTAASAPGGLLLQVQVLPASGSKGFAAPAAYRPLAWSEVEALARSEGVELARTDSSASIAWGGSLDPASSPG